VRPLSSFSEFFRFYILPRSAPKPSKYSSGQLSPFYSVPFWATFFGLVGVCVVVLGGVFVWVVLGLECVVFFFGCRLVIAASFDWYSLISESSLPPPCSNFFCTRLMSPPLSPGRTLKRLGSLRDYKTSCLPFKEGFPSVLLTPLETFLQSTASVDKHMILSLFSPLFFCIREGKPLVTFPSTVLPLDPQVSLTSFNAS